MMRLLVLALVLSGCIEPTPTPTPSRYHISGSSQQ